jgi:myo-inositol-1(or 4)-monophosphatase
MKALSVAIEAALAGGAILKSYYGGAFRVAFKGELDLVTQADTESEAQVLSILRARLPDVSILAEESGVSDRDTAQRFIVDPLDGTTNFAHAYPMFAVSIGYEEDGRVRAGVVYDPIREELFTAEQGRGAFLNGSKLHVSTTDRIEHSLLVTGFPYDLKDDLEGNLRLFERFMGIARAIRRDGSAALDLCYVAAGRFDGFWEEKLGPWDTAAGALIVEGA